MIAKFLELGFEVERNFCAESKVSRNIPFMKVTESTEPEVTGRSKIGELESVEMYHL